MGQDDAEYSVTCPHCGREFNASLMTEPSGAPGGFKCPHCRLFVPFERAKEQELIEPAP